MLCRRLWHLEISPQKLCFCINFSIHAFVVFSLSVRLFIDDFWWRSLSHLHFYGEKAVCSPVWTMIFESICAQLTMFNRRRLIEPTKRQSTIKLCSRIEVSCKHMSNTTRRAASCRTAKQSKVHFVKCGKRFEGTGWLLDSCAAPWFPWTEWPSPLLIAQQQVDPQRILVQVAGKF